MHENFHLLYLECCNKLYRYIFSFLHQSNILTNYISIYKFNCSTIWVNKVNIKCISINKLKYLNIGNIMKREIFM